MENTSFPAKGEKCVHPDSCFQRQQRIRQQFAKRQVVIEYELQHFFADEAWKTKVHPSRHAQKRMVDRSVSMMDVYQLVELGYPIACEGDSHSRALMGHIKVGPGQYRTFHILYRFQNEVMNIVTLYEPKHSAYLYDSSLEYRICWCADHPRDFS